MWASVGPPLLTCVYSHLYKLQVWACSDRVVRYIDLQEWVELVVAAAKSWGDGIYTITPVQRVWVVESKWPWRRFVFCRVMCEENTFKHLKHVKYTWRSRSSNFRYITQSYLCKGRQERKGTKHKIQRNHRLPCCRLFIIRIRGSEKD